MNQSKRDETQKSTKLHLDKYYTSPELAKYVVDKTMEIVKPWDRKTWIEPSAGNGVFLQYLSNVTAYDIEPEHPDIIQADFLKLRIKHKQGRCIIGNPPYGSRLNLVKGFCNKSFDIADTVSFILPISQLNNTQSIYKFNLIHSEDLGLKQYSGRDVHCCLNIYRRPKWGFNKRKKYTDSEIIEVREVREVIKNKDPKRRRELDGFEYDFGILAWGGGVGRNLRLGDLVEEGQVAKTLYIKIKNGDEKLKEAILSAKWDEIYPMTATPNLLQWQVYKFVEDYYSNKNNEDNK